MVQGWVDILKYLNTEGHQCVISVHAVHLEKQLLG